MKNQKKNGGPAASRISDARFASFETDPRFRLPSKKHTKTTIDKRFSGVFKDKEFTASAKVDRYGRKIESDSKKKALQRLYQEEGEDDENEDDDDDEEADSDAGGKLEVDADELVQRELLAAHEHSATKIKKHDPARGGGFSSSESDSDDDESDQDAEVVEVAEGDMQRLQDEQADVQTGEITNRIAIVNLDWDHVKSTDLLALFSSFVPDTDGGYVVKVSVYPSEFGKERMQQEELEGPPKALFKNEAKDEESSDDSSDDEDEDSEDEDAKIKKALIEEGDDQDFDSDALRSYQLDRLRYYYAVMICSSPETAHKIYEATDGTEYQSSSNFIDLRFVPDEVTFDDEPRDECDKVPDSYKPVEFITNALQSSKVKLTWDMHPEETSRKESINRAFTGSRADIGENDLRAYLASDSEDEEAAESEQEGLADDEPKLTKKELARKKMREALGLGDEPTARASKDGPVGDMQITFAPALTEKSAKNDDKEETTIEKYQRKERERKESKRTEAKARREAATRAAEEDSFAPKKKSKATAAREEDDEGEDEEDLGFDDPFFTTDDPAPPSKSAIRKEERIKKREAREAAEAASLEQKAHLTKVMAEDANDNQAEHLDHFDMNEIIRAEKAKGKKKKGKFLKDKETKGGLQEEFEMDVDDDRFKAVFDSHEFAIDPSNPKFKATQGMQQLLEEGRKKRRGGDDEGRSSKKSKKSRR